MAKVEGIGFGILALAFLAAGILSGVVYSNYESVAIKKRNEMDDTGGFKMNSLTTSSPQENNSESHTTYYTTMTYHVVQDSICTQPTVTKNANVYMHPRKVLRQLVHGYDSALHKINEEEGEYYVYLVFYVIIGTLSLLYIAIMRYSARSVSSFFSLLWAIPFIFGIGFIFLMIWKSYELVFVLQDFKLCVEGGLSEQFFTRDKGFFLTQDSAIFIWLLACFHVASNLFLCLNLSKPKQIIYDILWLILSLLLLIFIIGIIKDANDILNYSKTHTDTVSAMKHFTYLTTLVPFIYQLLIGIYFLVMNYKLPEKSGFGELK